jgi:hypothetical protein
VKGWKSLSICSEDIPMPVSEISNTISRAAEGSAAFQAVPAGILPAPQAEPITPAVLQNTIDVLASELRTQTLLNAQDRARFSQLESQFQTFNQRFLNNIVDGAICQGKILPTEREHWRNQLEKDFDVKTAELANAQPVLKTQFTRQFSNSGVSASPNSFERTRKIQNLIEDKMRTHGYGYDRAWEELKAENPTLFATMQTPTPLPQS